MIEFIKGEERCRWNGILMTSDNHEKLFGIHECEPIIEDDFIEIDNVIYTDLCFGDLFNLMIKTNSKHRGKEPEYDEILSQGHGFGQYCERAKVQCSYIIKDDVLERFEGIITKPYCDFKKDYPNFNREKFFEFQKELDEYYDNKMYLKIDE